MAVPSPASTASDVVVRTRKSPKVAPVVLAEADLRCSRVVGAASSAAAGVAFETVVERIRGHDVRSTVFVMKLRGCRRTVQAFMVSVNVRIGVHGTASSRRIIVGPLVVSVELAGQ